MHDARVVSLVPVVGPSDIAICAGMSCVDHLVTFNCNVSPVAEGRLFEPVRASDNSTTSLSLVDSNAL